MIEQQENEANYASTSTAYVFYSTKYDRVRKDHKTMSDIEQAEKDAFTMQDILIHGLGLKH